MRRLNLLLKISLLLGLGLLFWFELNARAGLYPAWLAFRASSGNTDMPWLLGALLLMPLNPVLEMQKWFPLIRRYERITYFGAMQAVLSGAALSIFSPARLGEYGGRILHIGSGNRLKALGAHLLGNAAQMTVQLVLGMAGISWCLQNLWTGGEKWRLPLAAFALAGSVCVLLLYFYFQRLMPLLQCLPLLKSIKGYVKDLSGCGPFTQEDLRRILGWSALRYFVSCCQYYFLLQLFGIQTGLLAGFSCISGIFLFQTCVPLPPALNFLARGNIAILVWSTFGANEFSSIAVSYLLWIINLFLPALFGTFSILHVNITKSLGYENK